MEILVAFSVLAGFLLLGTLLRAKLKFFQYIFLPASVIGGFIGLIFSPMVMKSFAVIPIPEDWLTIYSLLPGILIVPVIASVPFGVKFTRVFGKQAKEEKNRIGMNIDKKRSSTSRNVILLVFVLFIVTQSQGVIGLAIHYVFSLFSPGTDFYPTFGTEVAAGFSGGHGTAGVIGNLLHGMNEPYWEVAQGVTVTMATFGIICGILIGIAFINFASRKGHTEFLSGPGEFSSSMLKGYERDPEKRESIGQATTVSTSIDTLAFHIAILLAGSGLSYGLLAWIKYIGIPILDSIPVWAYAVIVMYGVWWLMTQLNVSWMIDKELMSKIASTFTDFAVVAAIISIPIEAVMSYFLPVIITVLIALAVTTYGTYWLCRRLFKRFWFERSMAVLGTTTGVFITGLLLLKMVDPEYKSTVLTEYSISYSVNSIFSFVIIPLMFGVLISQGIAIGLLVNIGIVAIGAICLFFYQRRKYGASEVLER